MVDEIKSTISHKTYNTTEKPNYFGPSLFEWRDRIYYKKQGGSRPIFTVFDNKHHKIEEVRVLKDKDTGEWKETDHNTIARFSVKEIYEYEPITKRMAPTYSMELVKSTGKIYKIPAGNSLEIMGALKEKLGLLIKQNGSFDLLNQIIAVAEETGQLIYKFDPPYPGFFWRKKKLYSTKEHDIPSPDDIRKSLKILEKLAEEYSDFKEKGLSFVLHWHTMAPFSFAKKQMEVSDKIGALYIYGSSRAGKTTIAQLSAHIWDMDIPEVFTGAGATHSEAVFGVAISKNTYPHIFDEAERLIDPRNEGLSGTFKNSVLYLNARGRHNPITGKYEDIPALSAPIITSNSSQPNNAALGARMSSIEYIMNRARTGEEQKAFNIEYDPENSTGPLRALKHIGNFFANVIMDDPSLLKEGWQEISEEIWKDMYEFAGLTIPKWLEQCGEAKGFEEAWEEEDAEAFSMFTNTVLRNAKIGEIYDHVDEVTKETIYRPRTTEEKVESVVKGSREPWITYKEVRGKEVVEISTGIVQAIYKEYGIRVSLKILANDLNAEYLISKHCGKPTRVARWEYSDFVGLFTER